MTETGRMLAGRYRLDGVLGEGGFGRVWRATDELLRVDVALKELLLPQAPGSTERRDALVRAMREARNGARLRTHPNIVAVHDVVEAEDKPWIVMELVAGESLDKKAPIQPGEVVRLAHALLDALEAAHAAEITHRDLKPANVLLDARNEALLTDFGIAKAMTDGTITATGKFIGSLAYMAPERFDGQDGPAGDLFSLGVTLYYALEGRSPFQRASQTGTFKAVIAEDPAPPTAGGPGLTRLIMALLNKDPAARPSIPECRRLLNDATKENTKENTQELTREITGQTTEVVTTVEARPAAVRSPSARFLGFALGALILIRAVLAVVNMVPYLGRPEYGFSWAISYYERATGGGVMPILFGTAAVVGVLLGVYSCAWALRRNKDRDVGWLVGVLLFVGAVAAIALPTESAIMGAHGFWHSDNFVGLDWDPATNFSVAGECVFQALVLAFVLVGAVRMRRERR